MIQYSMNMQCIVLNNNKKREYDKRKQKSLMTSKQGIAFRQKKMQEKIEKV